MGYNVHDVLRKAVAYYIRFLKKNQFSSYDLKLSRFKKMKH